MDWSIIREGDDNLVDTRVSLGYKKPLGGYIVFRGDPEIVRELLEESLKKFDHICNGGKYTDRRGRPQG